jgi:hypothetical protein
VSAELHLYALLDAPPAAAPPRGAFGEALVSVDAGFAVAVAGAVPSEPSNTVLLGEEGALAHAATVAALAGQSPAVLPSRFGVRFADEDALRSALQAERAQLLDGLAAVRGCVEVAVTAVFPPQEPEPAPLSGREYLERRLAQARRVDALVEAVHRPLAARARDSRLDRGIAPLRFSASYLVERDDAEDVAAAADDLARTLPDVDLVRGGPWPPYSFAGGAA